MRDETSEQQEQAERAAVEGDLGGQYQIIRRLGRGAFGAVYLARERLLHRPVAIKVLHAGHARDPVERERLLREARTVANLSHPAIVPVLAFGESACAAYMVMPHVGGESLADRLRGAADAGAGGVGGAGRLPPAEVRRILTEIADALAYAHAQGVLHRDLKAENVLLERPAGLEDDPPRVRLIDFGVAAFRTRDLGMGARDEVWGTPQFMAPEQAFGEPELDPRSELYALGVLGYLMLGGRLPFDATTPAQRLVQQQAGPRQRLGAIAPGAAPDLVGAIERCLAYEPADRWPRARDFRDALARGTANDAVLAADVPRLAGRLRQLGRVRGIATKARDAAAAVREEVMAGGLVADLRFAVRTFRKTPAFITAVVLTLAIGIGATTAVFSAVEALLLRPVPVADPGSLVVLQENRLGNNSRGFGGSIFPYARYLAYRAAGRSVLADLAGQTYQPFSVRVGDGPRRAGARETPHSVHGLVTSGNYFSVLGARPALGAFYTAEEDAGQSADGGRGAARPVAVVSYAFWRRALDGDSAAVGRTLVVDGRPLTVVGVAPPKFRSGVGSLFAYDVWVPAAVYRWPAPGATGDTGLQARPDDPYMNLFGRLRPDVDTAAAHTALRVVLPRAPGNDPDERITDTWVEPLRTLMSDTHGPAARFLVGLFGLAGVVLLVAATNAAGMLLARAAGRRREMAARLAVGASRGRVVRQLLAESTLVCAVAGAAGLAVAWGVARAVNAWQPPFFLPVVLDVGIDGRVLAVAAASVLGTAMLAGLAPALQATDVSLAGAMKDGGLQSSPRRTRLRGAFVVAQVALSVVLLSTAGLFGRALREALTVDPGFRTEGLVHADLDVAALGYADDARNYAFMTRYRERLLARPEVAGASFAAMAPLIGSNMTDYARRPDRPDGPRIPAQWGIADVGFVEMLGTPLLAGRTFARADGPDAPRVTVINLTFAHRFWPGESPTHVLGRRVRSLGREMTVVGVIGNGRYTFLDEPETAFGYVPFAQRPRAPTLYVRARDPRAAGAAAALRAAREELAALAPDLALHRLTPVLRDLDLQRMPQRLAALVVGVFGAIGLVLATTGLYGVLSYTVAQRRREFGVRMALGAPASSVVRLVVRYGLALTGLGVAVGLTAALLVGRAVSSFLFGISPADPITFVVVPLLLGLAAVVASAIPARRAARSDPMAALRAE